MSRDNRDRYGWRHRRDNAYEMGEPMPGTTGESEGTIYDRASSDNNVISGGKAHSYESHKRNKSQADGSLASRSRNITKGTTNSSKKQKKSKQSQRKRNPRGHTDYTKLDGNTVEVTVNRISNAGNPIATHQGTTVHVEGGEPGQTYTVRLSAKVGYLKGTPRIRE